MVLRKFDLCSYLLNVKAEMEKASDEKDRLMLKKMEESDAKTRAQEKAMALAKSQEDCKEKFSHSVALVQVVLH